MKSQELTMFQQSQLSYLKQQVDRLQEEKYRRDARPNAGLDLFAAHEELDNFVQTLRQAGKNI